MNAKIFMTVFSEMALPDYVLKATLTEDVIGTVLRIHLICEQAAEAWICGVAGSEAVFGSGKDRVIIECDKKLKIAKNLGLPDQLFKAFKTINSLRNDIAHNHDKEDIPNSKIQSIKDSLNNYKIGSSHENLDDIPFNLFDESGGNPKEYFLWSDDMPNKLKLCALTMHLISKLTITVAQSHKGRWDNDYTQR